MLESFFNQILVIHDGFLKDMFVLVNNKYWPYWLTNTCLILSNPLLLLFFFATISLLIFFSIASSPFFLMFQWVQLELITGTQAPFQCLCHQRKPWTIYQSHRMVRFFWFFFLFDPWCWYNLVQIVIAAESSEL